MGQRSEARDASLDEGSATPSLHATHDDGPPAPAARSRARDAVLVVGSLAAGLLLAWLLFGRQAEPVTVALPEPTDREGPSFAFDDAPTGPAADVAVGEGADRAPVGAATTPEEAATAFLAGEVDGDHAASHAQLAASDRQQWDSVARWTAAHAQFVPLTGFRVLDVAAPQEGTAVVTAAVRLASGLDPVLGLVPARGDLWLTVVDEDGRWAVDWSASELAARYPDEAGAVDAARRWAQDTAACRRATEYEDGLFGTRSLVDDLCADGGPVEVGDVTRLPADGGDRGLVSSFGADVVGWARVVPLTAPVPVDVVLAPVDDEWLVIGVLTPRG